MKRFFITIVIIITACACSILETREPENPEGSRGTFVPPTTPDIVMQNLIEAFNNKNGNNYSECFSKTKFKFYPTSNVMAKYQSIFQNWDYQNEQKYMKATIANMQNESNPQLIFDKQKFDFISTDSAVFNAEYMIRCDFQMQNIENIYEGQMIITISAENNGLWAITKWQDFDKKDSQYKTWSQLKANFYN
ncbi:MAG: hypothetical protein GX372_07900 [Ignavibacteria bacterium]|jgi:hypothetical protein|nr:hypothetical protein [Ignavibacteria bacterium]